MALPANKEGRRGQNSPAAVSIDDAVLVQQCRTGDSAAMERLILKYQHRIYNTILKICANTDDAAELTQDTFVKVIENIARFQGRSSFYTWIFRIAVNLTLNHCRRKTKLQIRSLEAETVEISESRRKLLKDYLSDEKAQDPEEVAQNRELGQIALEALNRLSEEQRAVLVLRDIEGMNYARIAVVLNVQLGTVRSRLSRARGSLKQIMEAFVNEG